MRLAPLVPAALLLLALAPAHAEGPVRVDGMAAAPYRVQQRQPFLAHPADAVILTADPGSLVSLRIDLLGGDAQGLTVRGPGHCNAEYPEAGPGDSYNLWCGVLSGGRYTITLTGRGKAASGLVTAQGGTLESND
jgi:hypothetical protein